MRTPTLLTYEEAKSIVDINGDLIFYESIFIVSGYKVSIFNYRLAQFNNFISPIVGSSINALEMRGLTFVFNHDGSLFKRYLMLSKFFNLNQVPDSLYDVVHSYEISNVMNKEDGSLISFIQLPNGEIVSRTKMSFDSDQAIEAYEIYKSDVHIRKLIKWSFINDVCLYFEYVSHKNRIVLSYTDTNLILLRARCNKTGKSIDIRTIECDEEVKRCEFEIFSSLDDIIELSNTTKDKEGWVVEFTNGYVIKIKTKWYFDIHHLNFDVVSRENDIIRLILNEEIDDVLSQLSENDIEKREFIQFITNIVNHRFEELLHGVDERIKKFDGDVKSFVNYLKDDKEYFYYCMEIVNGKDKYQVIKERLIKETAHLRKAQEWIQKYK